MGGGWCNRHAVCFELHISHTTAEHPGVTQVPLTITYVKNQPSKVRAESAWKSIKCSSFPTEIAKIEVLVKTVRFTAMQFISLPSFINFSGRDCYFQLSSSQPIEMGESHYILLKAKVPSSQIDPQPRFAEWKPNQSPWGISSCHGSDLFMLWPSQTFGSWVQSYRNWQLRISPIPSQNCPVSHAEILRFTCLFLGLILPWFVIAGLVWPYVLFEKKTRI